MNAFDWELSQPELQQARESIPVAIGILSGLKGRPIPMVNITQQVEKSRQQNFGVSFFFYETLWNMSNESPSYRRRIFREILQSANPQDASASEPPCHLLFSYIEGKNEN